MKTAFVFLTGCIFFLLSTAWQAFGQGFIPNKGQWIREVESMSAIPSGYVWVKSDALRFGLHRVRSHHAESEKEGTDPLFHAYEMQFPGSKPGSWVEAGSRGQTRYQFFMGNDRSRWVSGLQANTELRRKELYPGVDLRLYFEGEKLKYDVEASNPESLQRFRIRYEGLSDIRLFNGSLYLKTALGEMVESIPQAWQICEGKKVQVNCRFVLEGNEIRFQFLEKLRSDCPVVVDPLLVFLTYSGGASDNWGNAAVGDVLGNAYIAGQIYGPTYPVTLGVFDPDFNGSSQNGPGSFDIGVMKFSPNGNQLLYSTFLGGAFSETPHSINVDSSGSLVVMGSTSSLNFPVTAGAFQSGFGGGTKVYPFSNFETDYQYTNGSDIFVTRFQPDFSGLVGSTYIGGTGNDGLMPIGNTLYMNYGDAHRGDVAILHDGSILIASLTNSSSSFPVTSGSTYGGGPLDGVVFRLSPNAGSLIWSRYLGGSEADALFSIQRIGNQQVAVCGGSRSVDFPTSASAAQSQKQPTLGNQKNSACDAVVAILNVETGNLDAATFAGTGQYDQAYLVQTDVDRNVYILGQTTGKMGRTAGHVGQDSGRVFIRKYPAALDTVLWSTTFGSTPNSALVPSAFLVDTCGRIYFSGWGGESNSTGTGFTNGNTLGFPVTPDAIKGNSDGSDFYFCVLSPDAFALELGSYLGGNARGEHVDGGMSRFDPVGTIYQATCGCRFGNNFLQGTPGSYQPNIAGFNCNQGIIKINLGQLKAEYQISSTVQCDSTVTFRNLSINGRSYTWYFGDGDSLISDAPTITHTFPGPGEYIIRLQALNPNTCRKVDVYYDTIRIVNDLFVPQDTLRRDFCPGEIFDPALPPISGIIREWLPHPTIVNNNLIRPLLQPIQTTYYSIRNTTPLGCVYISRYLARQKTQYQLNAGVFLDLEPCLDSARIRLAAVLPDTADSYSWYFQGTRFGTGNPVSFVPSDSGRYVFLAYSMDQGCTDSLRLEIDVPPFQQKLNPRFQAEPWLVNCAQIASRFQLNSDSGTFRLWNFGDGNLSYETHPVHLYASPGTYQVQVRVQNELCSFEWADSIFVPNPQIPNFLSSNSDDKNDVMAIPALPPGSGLAIYNRWGKEVFHSQDYQNNWSAADVEPGVYFFQLRLPSGESCRSWLQVFR